MTGPEIGASATVAEPVKAGQLPQPLRTGGTPKKSATITDRAAEAKEFTVGVFLVRGKIL